MYDYDDPCEDCGHCECACDEIADGYECGECGHEPTLRELQHGWCPGCAEDRAAARRSADNLTNYGRARNSGAHDAARNCYRPPVDSLVGAYHEGWRKVRPLPANAS